MDKKREKAQEWVRATVWGEQGEALLEWVVAQVPEALLPQNLDAQRFNSLHAGLHSIEAGDHTFTALAAACTMAVAKLLQERLGRTPAVMEIAEGMAAYTYACCLHAAEECGDAVVLGEFTVGNVTSLGTLPQALPVEGGVYNG